MSPQERRNLKQRAHALVRVLRAQAGAIEAYLQSDLWDQASELTTGAETTIIDLRVTLGGLQATDGEP